MKIEVEVPDEEIIKKFKLSQKKKVQYLKKTLKKYMVGGHPELKTFAECVVDLVGEILDE